MTTSRFEGFRPVPITPEERARLDAQREKFDKHLKDDIGNHPEPTKEELAAKAFVAIRINPAEGE